MPVAVAVALVTVILSQSIYRAKHINQWIMGYE